MKALAWLASIGSIAAGLYLLSTQAVAEDSLIEVIAHGMGIYFVAKGLYLGPSLWMQAESRRHLEYLAAEAGQKPETPTSRREIEAQALEDLRAARERPGS